ILAGLAGQYGLFAATYGIAAVHLSRPHTQVVVVGNNEVAQDLYRSAVAPFALNKAVIKLTGLKTLCRRILRPLWPKPFRTCLHFPKKHPLRLFARTSVASHRLRIRRN